MSTFRFLYLVSGQGRLMRAMIRATALGVTDFEVTKVVADRSCPALDMADALGVPIENVDYDSFLERSDYDDRLFDTIELCKPDAIVSNYNRLLRGPVLEHYKDRIINLHYSLLPAFPGMRAVEKALAYGVRCTGMTTHFINDGVDTGPIIAQAAVPLSPDFGVDDVVMAQLKRAVPLLLNTLILVAQGRVHVHGERRVVIDGADYSSAEFSPALCPAATEMSTRLLAELGFDGPRE